ncbi:MAG: DNA mismatch endonuclease Vsr [Planctomycetes bacterium]|nr:DNA mismatch endonuclease Vsr [Planctomycetota bacterium]
MDTLTSKQRSEHMARIRSKHTRPELHVRKLLRQLGCSYRLHGKDLPGHPDIVLKHKRAVIFIHGCFWHRHRCINGRRLPKSRVSFWKKKLDSNKLRDLRTRRQLTRRGWSVLVVWECELRFPTILEARVSSALLKLE